MKPGQLIAGRRWPGRDSFTPYNPICLESRKDTRMNQLPVAILGAGPIGLAAEARAVSHGLNLMASYRLWRSRPRTRWRAAVRPSDARRASTQLTQWGGFASTVCWPLTALLVEGLGWRGLRRLHFWLLRGLRSLVLRCLTVLGDRSHCRRLGFSLCCRSGARWHFWSNRPAEAKRI